MRHFIRALLSILTFVTTWTMASSFSWAEYRAFQLAITDTTTGQSRTVVSNLDDLQYAQYYPVKKSEEVTIQDTWMCWKRSDYFQKPCSSPRAPASITPTAIPANE